MAKAGAALSVQTAPGPKTSMAQTAPRRSFDAPAHGGEMGAPKPANPFRDRLAEIKRQSTDTANAEPQMAPVEFTETSGEQQPRKGRMGRIIKAGVAALVVIGVIVAVLIKTGILNGFKF
jgi:hypothetical protein